MRHADAFEALVPRSTPGATGNAIGAVHRVVAAAERDGARCSNGQLVEKLRHHRHLSGKNAAFQGGAR